MESGDLQIVNEAAKDSIVNLARTMHELAENIPHGESAESSSGKTRLTFNSTTQSSLPAATTPQARPVGFPAANVGPFPSTAQRTSPTIQPVVDLGTPDCPHLQGPSPQAIGPGYLPPTCTQFQPLHVMGPPQWPTVQYTPSFMDGFPMINLQAPYFFTGLEPDPPVPNNGE